VILCGLPIILGALRELGRLHLGLNVLVATAVILAAASGQLLEAGIIAFVLQLAILIEELAERGAHNAVVRLERLAPEKATVRRDGKEVPLATDRIRVGDRLVLRPGDRVAADGRIVVGTTTTDESMISGESVPVDKRVGSDVLAGTVNLTGAVEVDVTRVGEDSALGNIITLVKRAQSYQPQIIRLADRFFAYYTPIMIVLAIVVLAFTGKVDRMISLFLVGCACPILLSAPIATFMSLFRAGQAGVVVKAGPFIEASAGIRTVVFDKTGTLTTGQFTLRDVVSFQDGVEADEVLALAASAEQRSNHPLAQAIVAEAARRELTLAEPDEFAVIEGMGVRARFGKQQVAIGSVKVVEATIQRDEEADDQEPLAIPGLAGDDGAALPAYVVRDGALIGAVLLADELRPEVVAVCRQLRGLGIRRICLLTGDRESSAAAHAQAIGANDWRAELLPAEKVDYIRELQTTGQGVAMVGDGINDAPSLTVADLGVAMGIKGTDVATEASDAVLLQDDLRKVPFLIALARAARQAIFQNLIIAALINAVAIILAAMGWIHPVLAAILHNLGGVIVFLNGFRLASFHWDFARRARRRGTRARAKPVVAVANP
jgi:Cd2+/Zn2+-exporting ATPase